MYRLYCSLSILCTGCACQLIIKENDDDDDELVCSSSEKYGNKYLDMYV